MNKNVHIQNPCKRDCAERSPTCHAECEKYFKWREAREAEQAEKDKKRIAENNYHDHVKARGVRIYRKRRYGGTK